MKRTLQIKDSELLTYQEKVEEGDELTERVRQLERENSELKAAKLMSMFGAPVAPQPAQALEKQLEALRLQLSEKTNDFLRLKEDYDQLRDQGQPLHPVIEDHPIEEVNTSSIQQAGNVEEHPKYQELQRQWREREAECERLSAYSLDLEGRLQKLLGDFQLFRTKAHQMLAAKDDELDRAKGRSSPQKTPAFQNVPLGPEVPPQGKQLNLDYIKNVFIKYLEYQASANEKEALTLEKVLFTALQAGDKDVELIEKAR